MMKRFFSEMALLKKRPQLACIPDIFRIAGLFMVITALMPSVTVFAASADATAETTRCFLGGVRHYNNGNYSAAIDAFEKITAGGVQNGKLYYNLGNACFKKGDIGRAILWYERAARLIPHDPDLKFNLNYAQTFLKDKHKGKKLSVFGVLFFWRELLGRRAVQWTGLVFNLLLWSCLGARLLRRKKERQLKTTALCCMAAAVPFMLTAGYDYYVAATAPAGGREAVILPESVPVRSGWSDASTELFVLHAGTKITIDKEKDGYYRIRFSEDKIGWIAGEKAGVIEG